MQTHAGSNVSPSMRSAPTENTMINILNYIFFDFEFFDIQTKTQRKDTSIFSKEIFKFAE